MRLISARAWALVVLSAMLQVLCFPIAGQLPVWRAALAWVAVVPFLIALLQESRGLQPLTLRTAFWLGYVCGVLWYVGNCAWIYQTMYLYGGLSKPIACGILLLFSLYLGLYHALFSLVVAATRRSSLGTVGALLLAPFFWVAVELARSRVTGFPWDLLGNSQVDNSLLTRLAPVCGVMGISFVVVAGNASLASLAIAKRAQTRFIAGGVLVLALILEVGGSWPAKRPRSSPQPSQVAVMVQENISVGATARDATPLRVDEEIKEFSALSTHPQRMNTADPSAKPSVIIWPEAPSHLQSNDLRVRTDLGELARRAATPIVAGMLGVDFDKSVERGYYLYDSASFFDKTGQYQGRYDKIHLVPWGEYVPFKEVFAFAKKLTEGVGDMDRGQARNLFRTDGHTYGVFICYESIFGDEVRQFALKGADVFVNISDDGWYGDTGAPWQHLNMARMRAIENHRWVLRSTNTGETTVIDPDGNYIATERHVRTAYALPFEFERDLTFYTRFGDWFAYGCAIVSACALGYSFRRRMN